MVMLQHIHSLRSTQKQVQNLGDMKLVANRIIPNANGKPSISNQKVNLCLQVSGILATFT